MGTRGMAERNSRPEGQAAARGAARRRRPEHPLGALGRRGCGPCAASPRRRRATCGRRASPAARGRRARRGARPRRAARGSSGGSAVSAARDEPDRLEQLGGRRRLVDEPVGADDARHAARPRRRAAPCRGSRGVSARSALIRRHSAMPSPSSRRCSSSTTSGRSRASRSCASAGARPRLPTGTTPGSARRSMTSPARTAGCGSMTATRVTEPTLSAILQPDLNLAPRNP